MIVRIAVEDLQPGMYLHQMDVFWLKHPLVGNAMLLTDIRQINAIRESGVQRVYIDLTRGAAPLVKPGCTDAVLPPVFSSVAQPVSVGETTMQIEMAQAEKICLMAKGPLMNMFNDARLGKSMDMQSTLPLVEEITGSLNRHPVALLNVVRLKSHDDYTWIHSVAVCALMLSLAAKIGLNAEQAKRAGLAGLLHDVGKAAIPLDILNKPGELTGEEFEIIKYHPVAGAEMLRLSGACADLQDVALHHHEKVNGTGYPHGLRDGGISLLSRMAAICDVYDAVTANRPYKNAWNPAIAMHQMAKWHGHFDRKLLYAFVKTVGIYPVGSLVRLASGLLGVVTEPGVNALLQPKVCVFFSLTSGKRLTPYVIDLASRACQDSIVGAEEESCYPEIDVNVLWQQFAHA